MHTPISRRTLLRSCGVSLALPLLESMGRATAASSAAAVPPRRMVLVGTPFGFDPQAFVPRQVGRDYELPSHLELLASHREHFTVITGLQHPNTLSSGHQAEKVLFTGAPQPQLPTFRNTISLDQEFAEHVRGQTRFDSFVLGTGHMPLSFTRNGVALPSEGSPSRLFAKMFLAGKPEEAAAELERIARGRSMLDLVGEQAKALSRRVSKADTARLDEYFVAVRDVEKQLELSAAWVDRPKPPAPGGPPTDVTEPGKQPVRLSLLYDMVHLALMNDSTRAFTINTFGEHHDLSHHGREPGKREACRKVEVDLLKTHDAFLTKLASAKEADGRSLLDSTMVLLTSSLRDGNTHWTNDLPVILAGGGFKHGQHLAFNPAYVEQVRVAEEDEPHKKGETAGQPGKAVKSEALCNLFVSMLQRAGIETDRFSSATGPLAGVEMA